MKTYAGQVEFKGGTSFRKETDGKTKKVAREAILNAARRSGYDAPIKQIKMLEVV